MSDTIEWELLARYLANECSHQEKEKITAWLDSDPGNRNTLIFLQKVWDTPEVPSQKSDVKKLWKEVAERANITPAASAASTRQETKRLQFFVLPGYKRILKYAALLVLLISLLFILKIFKSSFFPLPTQEWQEISVDKGKKMEVSLDDSTIVTLDAGTNFRFPSEFSDDSREVFLNGEGYFKVSANKKKPFIVHANHAVITVVGTKFNVRAWQQGQIVKVVVVEGKVSLHRENTSPHRGVLISRGQLSELPKNGQPTKPREIDIKNHLGWINRDMVFEDVPLQEILYQLERWYDIRFIPGEGITMSDRLTVHLRDRPLEDILELIAALTDLEYKREGRFVYLNSRGS